MYCRNCGAQINDEALFCEKCGSKVAPIEQTVNLVDHQQQNGDQRIICPRCGSNNIHISVNTYQQKKKRSFLWNLFLVVITGGIWLIWMLVRNNSVEKQAKVYVCQKCGYTETTQSTDRPNWRAILSGGWGSLFAAIVCIILIIFIITFIINR